MTNLEKVKTIQKLISEVLEDSIDYDDFCEVAEGEDNIEIEIEPITFTFIDENTVYCE